MVKEIRYWFKNFWCIMGPGHNVDFYTTVGDVAVVGCSKCKFILDMREYATLPAEEYWDREHDI
jgi:hypothetical protein